MHRRSSNLTTGGAGRAFRRRSIVVGVITAATLAAGAPSAMAGTTLNIAVANNVYPAFKELASTGWLNGQSGAGVVNPFVYTAASSVGGFWRADDTTDSLRGITSGNLRKQLLGAGPYVAPGAACSASTTTCDYNPPVDAFFSADESNVNAVIPTASGGTCTTGAGQGQGGETVTRCPGIASSKTIFTVGKLAIYTCNPAWNAVGNNQSSTGSASGIPIGADANNSGNGDPLSPRCEGAGVTLSSNDMAGVIAYLKASTSNKISIALPSSAPFGAAAKQALQTAGAAASPAWTYNDSSGTSTQNAWPAGTQANHCEGTLPMGATCQVRLETGISQVRGSVGSGATLLGLAALSNLKRIFWTSGTNGPNGSPGGGDDLAVPSDDPNHVYPIDPSAYSLYGGINQYAVRTTTNGTRAPLVDDILAGIQDTTPQNKFAQYGYLPLP